MPLFFDNTRRFFGKLNQSQVDGLNERVAAYKAANLPLSHAAYMLATVWHETGARMQPCREAPNASEAWRKKNLRYWPWYGRGDVQTTWEPNYKKSDDYLGLKGELLKNPDLLLQSKYSIPISIWGMTNGIYTGISLKKALPNDIGNSSQFVQARRIINKLDRAELIAGYAIKFQAALEGARYV